MFENLREVSDHRQNGHVSHPPFFHVGVSIFRWSSFRSQELEIWSIYQCRLCRLLKYHTYGRHTIGIINCKFLRINHAHQSWKWIYQTNSLIVLLHSKNADMKDSDDRQRDWQQLEDSWNQCSRPFGSLMTTYVSTRSCSYRIKSHFVTIKSSQQGLIATRVISSGCMWTPTVRLACSVHKQMTVSFANISRNSENRFRRVNVTLTLAVISTIATLCSDYVGSQATPWPCSSHGLSRSMKLEFQVKGAESAIFPVPVILD